jgi:putative GTP pyrophosphokinase
MPTENTQVANLFMEQGGQSLASSIIDFAQELLEMENMYESATKEIATKLEILDSEFQVKNKRNPIHQIQRRVKSPQSIFEKLSRKGFEVSAQSAKENLNDIAGIRVICSYINDIYTVARLLMSQNDIEVVKIVDYIKNPKPNGYRSLHLVVKVPVFFSDRMEKVKVEVQIRTIAMDFWASLEHQLHYKAGGNVPPEIAAELKECADIISSTDLRMQNLHSQVENLKKVISDGSED